MMFRRSLCRRPLLRAAGAVMVVGAFSLVASGCGDDTSGPADNDDGTGGTGPGGPTPEECVPSKADGPILSTCGVFVDGVDGNDKAEGTAPAPFRTIQHALENANGRPIYVCKTSEAYTENIELTEDVELYGGLRCSDWKYGAKPTELRGVGDDVIPFRVGANTEVLVEDFSIKAADAVAPGASSVAAWTTQATATLRRVSFEAGSGAKGIASSAPAAAEAGADGNPGQYGCDGSFDAPRTGGATAEQTCGSVASHGGKGGDGYFSFPQPVGLVGSPAEAGLPGELPGGDPGTGGTTCTKGMDGADGAAGAHGDGATGIGVLTETGFVSIDGSTGADGGAGQGGGGGGHLDSGTCPPSLEGGTPPSSGSGGAGGCGGFGSSGGTGAGSSFAFVSIDAEVVLEDCSFITAEGGLGGAALGGGLGGDGGTHGDGGGHGFVNPIINQANQGCDGGDGGDGGPGGAGGGGLGGHSIAIAFVGATPTERGTNDFELGAAGKGGDSPGNPGENGVRAEHLDFSSNGR